MCCPNMGSDVTTRIAEAPMKNRSIAARIAKRVTQPDDLWSSTPLELLLKRVTETWRHDALAGPASIANWRTPMREAFALGSCCGSSNWGRNGGAGGIRKSGGPD